MFDYNKQVGFDFETYAITDSAPYPKPFALSLVYADSEEVLDLRTKEGVDKFKSLYHHWLENDISILGHNVVFDLMVADTHFEWFDAHKIKYDCTNILTWLVNPELKPNQMALKSISMSWLGDPPDDQTAIYDWLYENQDNFLHKYAGLTKNGKYIVCSKDGVENLKKRGRDKDGWGAFISEAPFELVSAYALSDVHKTINLYNHIFKNTFFSDEHNKKEIWSAYQRELQFQLIMAERTRKGIRIDIEAMQKDYVMISKWLDVIQKELLEDLGITTINSGQQLSVALVDKGYVKSWSDYKDFSDSVFKKGPYAGKNVPNTGLESLQKATDHIIIYDIQLLKRLLKFRSTYITGWLNRQTAGRMHFSFFTMLVTGRIEASTLANIPKRAADKPIPCSPKYKEFQPPKLRKYILPEEGHTLITSDYAAQEARMLAHYSGGRLAEEFRNNPNVDIHMRTVDIFKEEFGVSVARPDIKSVNFGILYGQGDYALAAALGVTEEIAVKMKRQYLVLFDGIKSFEKQVKKQLRRGNAVHTIARRKFYKRVALYIYINRLIQGSSSDQLKASVVKYYYHKDRKGEFYFPLHDEEVFTVPDEYVDSELKVIEECMTECGIPLDVPFTIDIEVKKNNYQE